MGNKDKKKNNFRRFKNNMAFQDVASLSGDLKRLPSGGIQYPEGFRVYYSALSYGEISEISRSTIAEHQFYEFMLDGIRTEGMNKYDLTFHDMIYISWLRKTFSMGTEQLTLKSTCVNCEEETEHIIDYAKDTGFKDSSIEELPVILTLSTGQELHFKYMTIGDYIQLSKDDMLDPVSIFAKSITNLTFDEACNVVYNITGDDVEYLQEVSELLYHGLDPIAVTCGFCKYTYTVDITKPQEIIRPFRPSEPIGRPRISFGSKRDSEPLRDQPTFVQKGNEAK